MTPFEKATQVVATLRPHQAWNHIAKSDRQFLLVGDVDHGNTKIMQTVARALPVLGRNGFKHMGLERDEEMHGEVYNAFHNANTRQRRTKSDKRKLFYFLTETINTYVPDNEADIMASIYDEYNLQLAARTAGIRPYPIQQIMGLDEFIDLRYSPPKASEYNALLNYRHEYGVWPRGTTVKQRSAVQNVYARYDDYNSSRDAGCVRAMRKLAGQQRAIIFYGAGHFRCNKAEGMDKHLPKDSSVYVQVGERDMTISDMRVNFRIHRASVPDFVVTTDTKEAWVLPPAVKNGLWHG